jgi:hypothetical protein
VKFKPKIIKIPLVSPFFPKQTKIRARDEKTISI